MERQGRELALIRSQRLKLTGELQIQQNGESATILMPLSWRMEKLKLSDQKHEHLGLKVHARTSRQSRRRQPMELWCRTCQRRQNLGLMVGWHCDGYGAGEMRDLETNNTRHWYRKEMRTRAFGAIRTSDT